MEVPEDNYILLGIVNTKLRDFHASLDALCEDMAICRQDLEARMESIGYVYVEEENQFKAK